MADVIKTIRPSGGDYSTPASWESAIPADISGATGTGDTWIGEIYNEDWGNGNGVVPGFFSIDGHVTDSTGRIILRPESGAEHNGVLNGGIRIRHSGAAGNNVQVRDDYVELYDLQFEYTGSGTAKVNVWAGVAGTNRIVKNCLANATVETTTTKHFSDLRGVTCINCIAFEGDVGFSNDDFSSNASFFYNCVAAGSVTGFFAQSGGANDFTAINCLAYDCTTDFNDLGNVNSNSDYNATTGGSIPTDFGSNGVTGISTTDGVDLTSPSTNDYSLPSGSDLIDAGTTVSGYSDDIEGNTRSAPWDIGAFEFQGGGGGPVLPLFTNHYSRMMRA